MAIVEKQRLEEFYIPKETVFSNKRSEEKFVIWETTRYWWSNFHGKEKLTTKAKKFVLLIMKCSCNPLGSDLLLILTC